MEIEPFYQLLQKSTHYEDVKVAPYSVNVLVPDHQYLSINITARYQMPIYVWCTII